ncbi:MAG: TetR/AcrR family transcriptional regulator [Actinomycetota bacterium]
MTPPSPTTGTAGPRSLTADEIVEAAGRIVDAHGADALTMRRLADELGVAVTSIYWHVGNRDELVDALVDRLLADLGTLRPRGTTPRERIASLTLALRATLLGRPQLVALAHERRKTAVMFQPVRDAIAVELDAMGLDGTEAPLALRALQLHVVTSVLLVRTIDRYGTEQPVDAHEAFAFTLEALLDALGARAARNAGAPS